MNETQFAKEYSSAMHSAYAMLPNMSSGDVKELLEMSLDAAPSANDKGNPNLKDFASGFRGFRESMLALRDAGPGAVTSTRDIKGTAGFKALVRDKGLPEAMSQAAAFEAREGESLRKSAAIFSELHRRNQLGDLEGDALTNSDNLAEDLTADPRVVLRELAQYRWSRGMGAPQEFNETPAGKLMGGLLSDGNMYSQAVAAGDEPTAESVIVKGYASKLPSDDADKQRATDIGNAPEAEQVTLDPMRQHGFVLHRSANADLADPEGAHSPSQIYGSTKYLAENGGAAVDVDTSTPEFQAELKALDTSTRNSLTIDSDDAVPIKTGIDASFAESLGDDAGGAQKYMSRVLGLPRANKDVVAAAERLTKDLGRIRGHIELGNSPNFGTVPGPVQHLSYPSLDRVSGSSRYPEELYDSGEVTITGGAFSRPIRVPINQLITRAQFRSQGASAIVGGAPSKFFEIPEARRLLEIGVLTVTEEGRVVPGTGSVTTPLDRAAPNNQSFRRGGVGDSREFNMSNPAAAAQAGLWVLGHGDSSTFRTEHDDYSAARDVVTRARAVSPEDRKRVVGAAKKRAGFKGNSSVLDNAFAADLADAVGYALDAPELHQKAARMRMTDQEREIAGMKLGREMAETKMALAGAALKSAQATAITPWAVQAKLDAYVLMLKESQLSDRAREESIRGMLSPQNLDRYYDQLVSEGLLPPRQEQDQEP